MGVDFDHVRPLLKEYCLKCHSTEKQKGDLDLEVFSSLEAIKRHPKVWQEVAVQLAAREMPPKEKPQPNPEERARLTQWTGALLASMARERDGDPGPVVLRRLSQAEYTYSVRDLTGVEGLDPAREFPADGAAGEGFTNAGQALVMSPALWPKYLAAAKEIASHAVLLPDGFRFSAGTSRRDWTDEILGRIRAYYGHYTSPEGAEQVNLQGVRFATNGGGRLPLERYLAALLKEREALGLSHEKSGTLAAREGLSAKYLARLEQISEWRFDFVAPGRFPRSVESGHSRRRASSGGRSGGLAKGAVEVQSSGRARHSRRREDLDGAGQPAADAAGITRPSPDSHGGWGRHFLFGRHTDRSGCGAARARALGAAPPGGQRQAGGADSRGGTGTFRPATR